MWFKIYADGSEIDIIHARDWKEAIQIAKNRHGPDDKTTVWTWRLY